MELVNSTITSERIIEINSPDGAIAADRQQDLLKVAMFDRHHGSNKIAFGFLHGFGAKIGAVGLTTNLDENAPMIIGTDDGDMALCANALIVRRRHGHRGSRPVLKARIPFGGYFR
jgi:adenine deaminase